jgi:adenosylcobinamide-GDP ribazoletransferase
MRAASGHSEGRAAAAAVSFLTRIPLGRRFALDEADVARGVLLFPIVGSGVGAAVGGAALLFHAALPAFPAAALALVLGAVLTGGLHLDALADIADALGADSRERALQIMRDPGIGAFGATALGLDLLLKASAIAALLHHGRLVLVLLVAGALSRAIAPSLALALPYARSEPGPGGVLSGRLSSLSAIGSLVLGAGLGVLLLGGRGAIMVGAIFGLAVVLAAGFRRWLGGITGDALGAAVELTETLALLVALALS